MADAKDLAQLGDTYGFILETTEGFSVDDSCAPLVVLAGWVGCQQRHLKKFSSLLNEAGYSTVRAVCPTSAIFWPTRGPRERWTRALLDFVAAVDPEGRRPLVFWAFSNGGAFPVGIANRLVQHDRRYQPLQPRVLGTIFDSSPCYMHATTGAAALGEGQPALVRALAAAVFFAIVMVMLLTDPTGPKRFWREMAGLQLGGRSLYLYSADDHLCDANKLEELIAARRAAGHAVRAHRWERSCHVGHLRHYPEQYRQLVLGFLEELQQAEQGQQQQQRQQQQKRQ